MVSEAVGLVATGRMNALITGPAGVGKTEALAEAARRDKRAVMVTVTPAEKSMRSVLALVMEAFAFDTYNSDLASMAEVLRHRLPDRAAVGSYLIVDEAGILGGDSMRQLLTYSDNHDFPLPIIFAGNEHSLKRTRANAAAFDQIMSRMTTGVRSPAFSPATSMRSVSTGT